MSRNGQILLIDNIVSPYGLALLSYAVFLFACVIPPQVYSYYMEEPDLMFLDSPTILFYSLCVAAFLVGVWIWGCAFPSPPAVAHRELNTRISPTLFILIPLTLAIAISILSSVLLIRNNPGVILLLLAQQGYAMKEVNGLDLNGTLLNSTPFLVGITWWAAWRYSTLGLRASRAWPVKFALVVAILSVVANATLTVSRSDLMTIAAGLAVLLMLRRGEQGLLNARFVVRFGMLFFAVIVFFFLFFAFLRGTDSPDVFVRLCIGYTVASYNRLAAIVNGELRYAYAGRGAYLSGLITFSKSLGRILPFREIIGSPDFYDLWSSEFGSVSRAGLDGTMIWSGAFGDIFSDLGWFSPAFLLGYGLLYGFIWKAMRAGKLLGVLLYPWLAFCVLFWFGSNLLSNSYAAFLVLDVIGLSAYEWLLVKQS